MYIDKDIVANITTTSTTDSSDSTTDSHSQTIISISDSEDVVTVVVTESNGLIPGLTFFTVTSAFLSLSVYLKKQNKK